MVVLVADAECNAYIDTHTYMCADKKVVPAVCARVRTAAEFSKGCSDMMGYIPTPVLVAHRHAMMTYIMFSFHSIPQFQGFIESTWCVFDVVCSTLVVERHASDCDGR